MLQIASWTYGKEKIRLHAHTEHSLEHYTDNEEWRLLKVSVVEDEYEHEGINVSFCGNEMTHVDCSLFRCPSCATMCP